MALAIGAGGWRLGLFAFLALLFMLLGNVWTAAMYSIYLMIASVVTAFLLGAAIGIWAANNDRVSSIVRADQRYAADDAAVRLPHSHRHAVQDRRLLGHAGHHLLRHRAGDPLHGIRVAHGADPCGGGGARHRLQRAADPVAGALPIAVPQVMLGLNQTIMLGFTMLVIAALVGTRDLGQMVFGSMTSANFGVAVIAGGSIALMAMVCDRIFQALQRPAGEAAWADPEGLARISA